MKAKETILHLTCMRSTKYGGIEHYIMETARQCERYGYKTVVQYEEYPKSSTYCNELKTLGVEVVVLQSDLNLFQVAGQVAKLLRTVRPVIIQTHFPTRSTLLVIPMIAKILGVRKTIATVHSMYNLSKKSVRSRLAYNCYDKVLCVSKAITENLLSAGVNPNNVFTLCLGVFGHVQYSEELRHQLRNEFQIPIQNKVFACIAFDSFVKGLDVLLEAFRKVYERYSNVDLLIVGVDPHQSQLPALVQKLGIAGRVHWAGVRDEGWQMLNAADIYIQPSRSEGLPLSVVEAMALKLPIVATRVGGVGEIVRNGETGYLCEPDNVNGLAEAMHKLLDQPEGCEEMGKAGHKRYMEILRGEKSVEALIQNYYLS